MYDPSSKKHLFHCEKVKIINYIDRKTFEILFQLDVLLTSLKRGQLEQVEI